MPRHDRCRKCREQIEETPRSIVLGDLCQFCKAAKHRANENRLRIALGKCLKAMSEGRPADPSDDGKWDKAFIQGERALELVKQSHRPTKATAKR